MGNCECSVSGFRSWVILQSKHLVYVAYWLEFMWFAGDNNMDIDMGCSYLWNYVGTKLSSRYISCRKTRYTCSLLFCTVVLTQLFNLYCLGLDVVQHGEKAYPYEMTGRSRSASMATVGDNRGQTDDVQQPIAESNDTAYATVQEEDDRSLKEPVSMSQISEADPVSAV